MSQGIRGFRGGGNPFLGRLRQQFRQQQPQQQQQMAYQEQAMDQAGQSWSPPGQMGQMAPQQMLAGPISGLDTAQYANIGAPTPPPPQQLGRMLPSPQMAARQQQLMRMLPNELPRRMINREQLIQPAPLIQQAPQSLPSGGGPGFPNPISPSPSTPDQGPGGGAGGPPTSWKMSIEPMANGGRIPEYEDGGWISRLLGSVELDRLDPRNPELWFGDPDSDVMGSDPGILGAIGPGGIAKLPGAIRAASRNLPAIISRGKDIIRSGRNLPAVIRNRLPAIRNRSPVVRGPQRLPTHPNAPQTLKGVTVPGGNRIGPGWLARLKKIAPWAIAGTGITGILSLLGDGDEEAAPRTGGGGGAGAGREPEIDFGALLEERGIPDPSISSALSRIDVGDLSPRDVQALVPRRPEPRESTFLPSQHPGDMGGRWQSETDFQPATQLSEREIEELYLKPQRERDRAREPRRHQPVEMPGIDVQLPRPQISPADLVGDAIGGEQEWRPPMLLPDDYEPGPSYPDLPPSLQVAGSLQDAIANLGREEEPFSLAGSGFRPPEEDRGSQVYSATLRGGED